MRRSSDLAYQWNSIDSCAGFLSELVGLRMLPLNFSNIKLTRNLVAHLLFLLNAKPESTLQAILSVLSQSDKSLERLLKRKVLLLLKVLSLIGCLRIVRSAQREVVVTFLEIQNIRKCVIHFLQNSNFTMKVEKKELRERLNEQRLMRDLEIIVDKSLILKSERGLFKSRTPSFDLSHIDVFLQKNQSIILPKTNLAFKRTS